MCESAAARSAILFFLLVSFVSEGIEACTSWETCYPPWPIVPLFSGHVMRSMHVASIKFRSVEIMRQLSWRSEIDRPKVLKEARRCQSVRQLLFRFTPAPAKCGRYGSSVHVHWGIRLRQSPKGLRICSLFGWADEPTIALIWGRMTNRAEIKHRESTSRVRADA